MQMQLVKHVTFSHAFIITYSKTEKVGNLTEIAQFQAGMQAWLPLVEGADCLPHRPEAPSPVISVSGTAGRNLHRCSPAQTQPSAGACPIPQENRTLIFQGGAITFTAPNGNGSSYT